MNENSLLPIPTANKIHLLPEFFIEDEEQANQIHLVEEYLKNPQQQVAFLFGPGKLGKSKLLAHVFSKLSRVPLTLSGEDYTVPFERLTQQLEEDRRQLSTLSFSSPKIKTLLRTWQKPSPIKMLSAFERGSQRIQGSQYTPIFLAKLLKNCTETYGLVFENFHQLSTEQQSALFEQLKPFQERGIPMFFVGTTYQENWLLQEHPQLATQQTRLFFSLWSNQKIAEYVKILFEKINFVPETPSFAEEIVQNAFYSPQIVREILETWLHKKGILQVPMTQTILAPYPEEMAEVYQEVAFAHGNEYKKMVEKLKKGFRNPLSLYATDAQLLTYLIEHPKQVYEISEIQEQISVSTSAFKEVLQRFNTFFWNSVQKTQALFYDQGAEKIYLGEPFFLFYGKHFLLRLKMRGV